MKTSLAKFFNLGILAILTTAICPVHANQALMNLNLSKDKQSLTINDQACQDCHSKKRCRVFPLIKMQEIEATLAILWSASGIHFHDTAIAIESHRSEAEQEANEKSFIKKNPDRIGHFFADFYGPETGEEISKLIREMNLAGIDYIETVKHDSKEKILKDRLQVWIKKGHDLADFLSDLNPKLSKKEIREKLERIINLEAQLAKLYFDKDFDKTIQVYTETRLELAHFGIFLAKNLINQIFIKGGIHPSNHDHAKNKQ